MHSLHVRRLGLHRTGWLDGYDKGRSPSDKRARKAPGASSQIDRYLHVLHVGADLTPPNGQDLLSGAAALHKVRGDALVVNVARRHVRIVSRAIPKPGANGA